MKTITLILFILCLHGLYGAISPELFIWHQPELQHISSSASRSVIAYSDEPYMFSGFNMVEVWDVSNPDLPRKGYTFHHNGVYVDYVYSNPTVVNNLLFFSVAPHTFVYDISDIYQPVLLYDISIQNSFCFGIFQNYLLLGMMNGDIMIYDFNDPADIQYKGLYNVLPCIWKIYEFGDKIAVSCGLYPSRTIKLLELNEITYTFSEYSSCELFAIDAYVGKLSSKMLVQTTENDIIVFDCSTQGTSALLTNFPASDEMLSAVTDGRLLYTVSAQNCLKAWEFNHQNEFACVSSYYFSQTNYSNGKLFKITGKILPCKAGYYAYWLDISDLQPPENLISQFENGIDISTMAFLDMGYGYIYYDSPQGFALLEINSDNSISENCVFDSMRTLYKLNMKINFLYGIGNTNYEQVIKAYDCSVPTQPVLVSEILCPDDALFKMSGDVLYAGPNTSFNKYRINPDTGIPQFETNLSFPNSIATTTAPISCNDVIEYQGNDYAVGQWRPPTYQWYPYLAYRFSDNEAGCVMQDKLFDRLYARDGFLYTLGQGIYTYSVFPDAAPELLNVAYSTSIFTKALCVIPYLDNYLIASYTYSNCIAVFDISSPANPVLVRKIQQPYPAYTMFIKGDKLFTGNGIHGISVYDLAGLTPINDDNYVSAAADISVSPNPFSTKVKLAFELKQPGPAKTAIYNIKGQLVKVIGSDELKQGKTELVWDGKDNTNRTCAAGVYFIRVNSATPFKVKKILKLQ